MATFERSIELPVSAEQAFAWHMRDGAFEDLVPPGDGTRVAARSGSMRDDTLRVELSVPVLGPVRQRWTMRHEGYEEGRLFVDVMERGAFPHWRHEHRFEPLGPDSCRLVDHIEYELPLGALGRVFGSRIVERRLDRTFAYRHAATARALGGA